MNNFRVGQEVEFKFQGSFEVRHRNSTHSVPNVGTIAKIYEDRIIVRTPNGALFHLTMDDIRLKNQSHVSESER